ncbi:MAG: hypothetical protein ABL949_14975 [Fimbriimonadaceae bacterium]
MDRKLWRLIIIGGSTLISLLWFAFSSSGDDLEKASDSAMVKQAREMETETTDAVRDADAQYR